MKKIFNIANLTKWWFFLALFFIMLPISVWMLRQNNLKMLELRDVVVQVDKESGNIDKIEPELIKLKQYVTTHMNASLPNPLELTGSFNKAVEKARKEAEKSGSANASVYAKAQAKCEDFSIPLTARAQCIQDFVLKNSKPGTDVSELKFPPKELYVYDFHSPAVSFDLTGLFIIFNGLIGLIAAALIMLNVIYPSITKLIRSDPLE